ncbi:MAG: integral rane sensor signal transduction histidine kinase [Firmicutes bacterium]|nr:integral rane sensor signal transduction histidine kinase [Bacillota bacterium]
MFQRTLRRLTLLNSIVFLLIFIAFGVMLYGYVARQLFDDIDQAMEHKVNAFHISNGRPGSGNAPPAFFDPRILILLRDGEGNIINLYPFPIEGITEITTFLDKVQTNKLQTRRIEDHVYRILSLPYGYSDNILIRGNTTPSAIQEVIAISIVDSEVGILRRFMFIIFTGQLVAMIVIIPAGYYLAQRALVPIRAAWEKQQQFVADASHELRTPLAVIKSNAELLLRHPAHTVEEETIRITNVVRETIRMSKLVSTLFTLARADANQIELQTAPLILSEVIIHVAEQFDPLAEMKNIRLQVDMQDEIEIVADKERLHQLFVILLDNAIKYTAAQGSINVLCHKQSNMAVIKVADTGSGIEPEDLSRIFDRFFRGDKVRSRDAGGAGLGLAIAHWIVEKHGGKIWATSEIGVGTQIYINLPIERM